MIRAMIWKEWREHRAKYIVYWVVLNAPMLLAAVAIAIRKSARIPFADLSNNTVLKYLPLALGEPFLLATVFLLLTGYLAVATFGPEIEDRSVFFAFEQPVSRERYVAVKLLIGGVQVMLASCFAILFATFVAYGMMLMSGKVTWAGSAAAFTVILAAAGRLSVWCSLISLGIFTAAALVAALVPRWWLAAACSVVMTAAAVYFGSSFFDFSPDMAPDSMSVGMSLSTGDAPWVTVSRAMSVSEVQTYAPWHALPLLTAMLLTVVFAVAIAQIYSRKELK